MQKLEDVWSEPELMEKLKVNKAQMASMRMKGLPVLRVSQTIRLYAEEDVVLWLEGFRAVHEKTKRVKVTA